jgi:hypothetical protein
MLTVLVLSLERCDPFVLLSSKESHGGERQFVRIANLNVSISP